MMRFSFSLSLTACFVLFGVAPGVAVSQVSAKVEVVQPKQFLEALPPDLIKNLNLKSPTLDAAKREAQKAINALPRDQLGTFRLKVESINKKGGGYLMYHSEILRVGGTPFSFLCEVLFGAENAAKLERLKPGKMVEVTGRFFVQFVPAEVDKTAAGIMIHIDDAELK